MPNATAAATADRWAHARAAIRTALARRLPGDVVAALLPRDPREPSNASAVSLPADFRALADLYPQLLADEQRKQRGAWFTPPALTRPTAARTLAPLLREHTDASTLRIVDPAVGGGAFLLAALHELRAAGLSAAHAVRCLHGVDIDSSAATLAALALWEECADEQLDPRTIAAQIRHGDGLLDLPAASFDAVLANPPWETLQSGPHAKAHVARLRPHFAHQGRGKLFTYRLFVERAFQLLRDGGRLGIVVPASLWFDRDAEPLRRLLLDRCAWQWLFGFENRRKVFPIDGRYRFGVVVATKGGSTDAVQVAFGRTELPEWAAAEPACVRYGRGELRALSPASGAFVEVDDRQDLDVLARMHAAGTPLLGAGSALQWQQGDFNMTSDRAQFVPCSDAERDGYRAGADAVWRCDGKPDLLPLYQGAMVHDLQPNAAAHAGGTGHATTWQEPVRDALRPVFLVDAAAWRAGAPERPPWRLVHRALSNASNERTALACLLPDAPCGNSLGVLTPRGRDAAALRNLAATAAVLSSLPFDWALRVRLGGTNLNAFVLADCVLPRLDDGLEHELADLALALCAVLPWHAPLWATAHALGFGTVPPAFAAAARGALHTRIDRLVGRAFGLRPVDIAWITRDCELPSGELARRARTLPTKGFWRIDRELAPAQRRPLRWRAAAHR